MCEREEYEEVARSVEHFATSILAQCRNSQEVSILCDVGKQAMILSKGGDSTERPQ